MDQLLDGLIVVEASRDVAVRYCGRLFAQFGATVVRAEGGDDTAIGYAGAAGEAYGRWLDAGKTAALPTGPVDLVIAGLDAAAVAVGEGLRGRLGGSLMALTWFHPAGPYAAWRGTDELINALGGIAYSFGPAEGPPTISQGHGPQIVAGLVGFNAAVSALIAQPRPARIEVNVLEAFCCLTETGAVAALMEGGLSVRLGINRLVPSYPCASYRSADGWVGVTTLTPAQWKAFCAMIGRRDLGEEARFATTLQRLMLADEVDALVAPPLRERTTEDWVRAGLTARVPITAMPDLAELSAVAHWSGRDGFATFDESGLIAPTLPVRATFTGCPAGVLEAGAPSAPLAGLRVVDFTMGWAGPLCTRYLADLGADVVKVESASHPDWWRGWEADQSGDPPPWETKFNYICVNRNKRGILLDLMTAEGLAEARALVARADVVVENFAAGILEKLGLGPDVRRALNPGLIAISMPAFGNGGPLSGIRAYGSTVEQASGLPFVNGRADWPPSLQHVAFGDPIAGLYAAGTVLAALMGRRRHGGAEIDLAQVACLFQFGADAFIAQQLIDGPLPRTGSRRPRAAPVCVVPAAGKDEWVAVAVDGAAAWRGLCAVLGREAWAADPALATREGRNREADRIEAAIAGWADPFDAEVAADTLQAHGVPAAPVIPVHALGYNTQLSETGFWPEMERRYVGRHIIPAAPFAYDGCRPALLRPAPTLGEHTDEVLAELDLSAAG
jgi:crotonobetainyl-CoA:carnitine CoA-transferase CaiB-like acyl-CoA transferase